MIFIYSSKAAEINQRLISRLTVKNITIKFILMINRKSSLTDFTLQPITSKECSLHKNVLFHRLHCNMSTRESAYLQ